VALVEGVAASGRLVGLSLHDVPLPFRRALPIGVDSSLWPRSSQGTPLNTPRRHLTATTRCLERTGASQCDFRK
jgi:hypothetical protein